MTKKKYGNLFFTEPIVDKDSIPRISSKDTNMNMTFTYRCVTKPSSSDKGHKHPCDQYLCFIGGNPMDIQEFGAEVELYIGEEHEKHIINKTTIVYIPAGLFHCPLNYVKVDKPIIFINIYPSGERQAEYEHVVV
jgi:hypothetical protein